MAWWNELGIGEGVAQPEITLQAGAGVVSTDLFTITGGRILLTSIIGMVETKVLVLTNMNVRLQHTPTTGAAGATDMCDDLDTKDDDTATLYTIDGGVGNAMVDDARAGVAIACFAANRQVLQPGTISMRVENIGGTGSGGISWTMHYIPIEEAASVVAA